MAWAAAMTAATKALPALAKHLPKLWPLLLDKATRDRVIEATTDLANQSPTRRLKAQLAVTAALADAWAGQAQSETDCAAAGEWSAKARKLSLRPEMPVTDRKARAAHRRAIRSELADLQDEINAYLTTRTTAG